MMLVHDGWDEFSAFVPSSLVDVNWTSFGPTIAMRM
jgi:hypothetical protein